MQQLLASVFMVVGAPVAIIALDGRFIAVNPAFTRLLRYGARHLDGRRFWDLIAGDQGAEAAAGATQAGSNGTPYELDTWIGLGDQSTARVHVTMTSVDQPQFKRFRIITLREAAAPAGLTSAATAIPKSEEVVVAGKIQLIGLDHVKAALGSRWSAHAERSMMVAETIIRRRLGPGDVFSRSQDQGFVICFAEGSEPEAAFRAATIAREIRSRLIGDADDPAASSVTAVTQSIPMGPGDMENGRPIWSALEMRLDAGRAEAERRARAELSVAIAVATLEPEQLFDNVGKPVPIVVTALSKELQEHIDVALATLPPGDGVDADMDVLKLALAAEAALADVGGGRTGVYLLPVDFAVFSSRKRQDRYIEICRKMQEAVRQRIMFLLSGVPKTVSQTRLLEIIRLLKPFGKGIGMDLGDVEFAPTDLGQDRIPLVAVSAEELLGMARTAPAKLAKLVRQLRFNGTRLVARGIHGESERNAVVGIGADLFSLATGVTREMTPSQLVGAGPGVERSGFATAIQKAPIAFAMTDITKPDNPIMSCNPAFTEISGYTAEEAIGRNWRFLHGRDTDQRVVAEIREAAERGEPIRREILYYRKDGSTFLGDLIMTPIHHESGALIALVGLLTDVTALRRAEQGRLEIGKFFENIAESIPGFVFQRVMTGDGRIDYTYVSPSFRRLVGVSPGEPNDRVPHKWIHPDDVAEMNRAVAQSAEDFSVLTAEWRLIGKSNEIRWIRSTARPIRSPTGNVVWNGVAVDITSEKRAEHAASYLGGHDVLTGVLNRLTFGNRLTDRLLEIDGQAGTLGIILIDIADFRTINDGFGMAVGDQVLKTLAERIAKIDGANLVGRVGGNAFAVVATNPKGTIDIALCARKLSQEIAKPIDVGTRSISVFACMGLALYPDHATGARDNFHQTGEALMKAADVALHTAKGMGAGSYQIYAPENDDRIRHRAILQQSLHEAFTRRQFVLHYQPVVELETGRILGAEALIRWVHPTLGMQRPDQFIPVAEKSGLIVPLGTWVMEDVLKSLENWELEGVGRPRIAVNVAAAQLQHPDSLGDLYDRIVESGFDPSQIEIELTESEFIDPTPRMLDNLKALRKLGVTVAIDDFGTGYSSFRYLRSLPIDKLKIDQSFVRNMMLESGDEAIVKGIISIGRDLGLTVVVEGVETAVQRDILLREGCRVGQGYFYSMPVTAEDFAWMYGEGLNLPLPKTLGDSGRSPGNISPGDNRGSDTRKSLTQPGLQ